MSYRGQRAFDALHRSSVEVSFWLIFSILPALVRTDLYT
jgi:hypothetical protein